ncbi:hypothetical protein [Candidatus Anaplasma sp. TIGMIC]|uniref:hypothetical protein n=1 Tax=Candidatus Anaplasma sp. TIGMIC TaxID=3020713 RepID=UPI00232DDB96|nr:hypothetical protein [Candidatus Anaplasma sp. TIGMIC]MDB1135754.1 hypothetical protein [Candidatus Anaplasma sp. TIGMIC]
MGFLGLCQGSAIMVLIGDNGAVIANIVNGVVRNKYFVSSPNDREWDRVKECIQSNRKASVYAVLDHSGQVYNRCQVPSVGKLAAGFVVKDRRMGIVDATGFSTLYVVSSAVDNGIKKLQYMAVECSIQDVLFKNFLDLMGGFSQCNFKGVLLFSVELAIIAHEVSCRENKTRRWVVFIVYTKVGDYRQIILHEGKLFSSTSVKILESEEKLPYAIAAKVYQEMQDAVCNIAKNNGPISDSDVGLYMVVPGNVKSCMLSFDLKKGEISVLTPYELGKVLSVRDCVSVGSWYCDIVILSVMTRVPVFQHVMHTDASLAIRRTIYVKRYAILPTFCAIVMVGTLYILNSVGISRSKSSISRLSEESAQLTQELQAIRNDREFTRINEMYDVLDLYRALSSVSSDPIEVMSMLGTLQKDGFEFTSLSWGVSEDFGVSLALGVVVSPGGYEALIKKLHEVLRGYRVVRVEAVVEKEKSQEFIVHLERPRAGE